MHTARVQPIPPAPKTSWQTTYQAPSPFLHVKATSQLRECRRSPRHRPCITNRTFPPWLHHTIAAADSMPILTRINNLHRRHPYLTSQSTSPHRETWTASTSSHRAIPSNTILNFRHRRKCHTCFQMTSWLPCTRTPFQLQATWADLKKVRICTHTSTLSNLRAACLIRKFFTKGQACRILHAHISMLSSLFGFAGPRKPKVQAQVDTSEIKGTTLFENKLKLPLLHRHTSLAHVLNFSSSAPL